jgi:signal transduction histidine kinase/CheY-like chemotaxis protein
VALYDSKSNTISLPFHVDQKDEITSFPAGKTLTAYVIRTKKSLFATPKTLDKLEKAGEIELFGAQSKIWVGIPLVLKKKAIGALVVQSYDNENAYNKSDISILEIIASGISSSLERKRFEGELKVALEKAKESDKLKSAFLANMSHEIRTPLNGILGFANLLAEPELTNDERSIYASVINKSSRRLMNTINDLIEISKIEVGQVDVINKVVSVNKLLNELYTFFLPDANEKELSLNVTYNSDEDSIIVTDEFLLNGILTNLIDNAIKFTNQGTISFGYEMKKDFVEFYVKDTGIGIPDNKKESIFNRFEQAETGHSRSYEGSGLGLSISKGYIEQLGGKIWLTSEEGKGSVFSFTIPYGLDVEEKHQAVKNPLKDAPEKVLSAETNILVVDDEEINLLFLEKILNDKYDNIAFAQSGEQAVETVESIPEIKVVLMDLKMHGIDGFEATRRIKKINKNIVVIAQTAYALEGDREKALEAGCDDYITKPIDKTKLLEMIEGYLGA